MSKALHSVSEEKCHKWWQILWIVLDTGITGQNPSVLNTAWITVCTMAFLYAHAKPYTQTSLILGGWDNLLYYIFNILLLHWIKTSFFCVTVALGIQRCEGECRCPQEVQNVGVGGGGKICTTNMWDQCSRACISLVLVTHPHVCIYSNETSLGMCSKVVLLYVNCPKEKFSLSID